MKKTVATQNQIKKFINLENLYKFLGLIDGRYANKREMESLRTRIERLETKLAVLSESK